VARFLPSLIWIVVVLKGGKYFAKMQRRGEYQCDDNDATGRGRVDTDSSYFFLF